MYTSSAVTAGCLNAGKSISPNCSAGEWKVTADLMVGMICDCYHGKIDRNGWEPLATDMGGHIANLEDTPEDETCWQASSVTDEVDATSPSAEAVIGTIDSDTSTVDTSCWILKKATSARNKADNNLQTPLLYEPHVSGPGDFHRTLLTLGSGMGDSTDVTSVVPFIESAVEEDDNSFYTITAGWFNAGKLLTMNVSSGEECNTAILTVGMMCDLTYMCHNKHGTDPHSADMVGTCKKGKVTEDSEPHLATCLTWVTENLDARTSTSDVQQGPELQDSNTYNSTACNCKGRATAANKRDSAEKDLNMTKERMEPSKKKSVLPNDTLTTPILASNK